MDIFLLNKSVESFKTSIKDIREYLWKTKYRRKFKRVRKTIPSSWFLEKRKWEKK